MSDYDDFIAQKALVVPTTGIASPPALNPKLKEHQSLLTRWALRRGRAAIFADTGLGKGWMVLEWARVVAEHTGQPVLVLAPLAVSQQFAREAEKLGVGLTICSSQADVRPGVNVTNYQKLHKFDAVEFGGVALDEASILKSLDGSTRRLIIESFAGTPFKLSATATPSPNDHTELGGQSEFLGIMRHSEMLATFFINDSGDTKSWRLKGHAREAFWKWVTSWGAIVKMPSDIGCSDDGYVLPPLRYHEHIVAADQSQARKAGSLFVVEAETLSEQRAARRGTLDGRVALAAGIVAGDAASTVFWCELNAEQEALEKALGDRCVSIYGALDDDEKVSRFERWSNGEVPFLVTKGSLFGFGINMQFCRRQVFVGVGHSFELFYQCCRRSWRFGVDDEVTVHIVTSEIEGAVLANLKDKMRKAEELSGETRQHVAAYVRDSLKSAARETIEYRPTVRSRWPVWLKSEVA